MCDDTIAENLLPEKKVYRLSHLLYHKHVFTLPWGFFMSGFIACNATILIDYATHISRSAHIRSRHMLSVGESRWPDQMWEGDGGEGRMSKMAAAVVKISL